MYLYKCFCDFFLGSFFFFGFLSFEGFPISLDSPRGGLWRLCDFFSFPSEVFAWLVFLFICFFVFGFVFVRGFVIFFF